MYKILICELIIQGRILLLPLCIGLLDTISTKLPLLPLATTIITTTTITIAISYTATILLLPPLLQLLLRPLHFY